MGAEGAQDVVQSAAHKDYFHRLQCPGQTEAGSQRSSVRGVHLNKIATLEVGVRDNSLASNVSGCQNATPLVVANMQLKVAMVIK